jgi:hypothetical protein
MPACIAVSLVVVSGLVMAMPLRSAAGPLVWLSKGSVFLSESAVWFSGTGLSAGVSGRRMAGLGAARVCWYVTAAPPPAALVVTSVEGRGGSFARGVKGGRFGVPIALLNGMAAHSDSCSMVMRPRFPLVGLGAHGAPWWLVSLVLGDLPAYCVLLVLVV